MMLLSKILFTKICVTPLQLNCREETDHGVNHFIDLIFSDGSNPSQLHLPGLCEDFLCASKQGTS